MGGLSVGLPLVPRWLHPRYGGSTELSLLRKTLVVVRVLRLAAARADALLIRHYT